MGAQALALDAAQAVSAHRVAARDEIAAMVVEAVTAAIAAAIVNILQARHFAGLA